MGQPHTHGTSATHTRTNTDIYELNYKSLLPGGVGRYESQRRNDPSTGRVKIHLLKHSFMPGYTRWTSHGEDEEGAEVEVAAHNDELEGGMKKKAKHENHLDGQEGRAEV